MIALIASLLLSQAAPAAETTPVADPRKAECIAVADKEATTEAKIDAYGACMTGNAGGGIAYRPPPKDPVVKSGTSFSVPTPGLPDAHPVPEQTLNMFCATSTDQTARDARGC